MKKLLCLMLALLIAVPFFASCDDTKVPDSSTAESQYSSDDTSVDESQPDIPEGYNNGADIDALFVTELPAEREYINIINGQEYSFNRDPSDKYTHYEGALTDKADPDVSDDSGWIGFLGKDDIEISLDLGKQYDGVCGFSINVMLYSEYGRGTPRSARLYVSSDGETYTKAIGVGIYAMPANDGRVLYTIEGYSEKGFGARYIKLVLGDLLINWTFIDGLRIYTCGEVNNDPVVAGEYYKNDPMPEVTEDLYWDSSETDYSKEINLIRGLGQRFYALSEITQDLRTSYYNVQPSTKALTDGQSGVINYTDPSFAHFTGAGGRDIVYDIGRLSTVRYATFSCMVDDAAGIRAPELIQIQLSEDGVEWQTVASKKSSDFITSKNRAKIKLEFNQPAYKARFVKFVFKSSAHSWVDELEVFGTKEITSDAKKLEGASASINDALHIDKYPALDVLGGSENIYLAYNYKVENRAAGLRSKEQYKPLVGYYDKDGNLLDFFFDSYLYLPCSTTCPSGGLLWESSAQPSFMSDWLDYEADLYADGYNIKALNEAVGEVKEELSQPDYKAFVYLSIFNLAATQTNFGDIDGDGISENASSLATRKKIAKWWIDRNIEKYNECNFENLKLNGFYWYDESISYGASDKRELVQYIVDYVHSLGYYIIWIPYYQAGGYMSCYEMGFDCANMQPNYMFVEDTTEQRLYDNANTAYLYGMGVEIEADGRVLGSSTDRYDRYMAYLRVGVEKGYMNSIKMYYCDAVPGVFLSAYNNADPKYHAVYDITYLYAKRKLTVDTDISTLENVVIEAKANKTCKGDFSVDSYFSTISIVYGANHGIFSLNPAGAYKYVPDKNFVGEDRVVLEVGGGISKRIVTIKINVSPEDR